MSTPAEVVAEQFSQSRSTAATYVSQATSFTNAFQDSLFPAALVDVTFAPVTAPTALTVPERPSALDSVDEELTWDSGGGIAASMPGELVLTAPSLTIDNFEETAPEITFDTAPTLDFGTAPELDFGTRPMVDDITEVDIPEAPTVELVALPTLLTLTTPTFPGIDLHESFLTNLETVPELSLPPPTPYTYTAGAEYASSLLTALSGNLASRITGGTGLDPSTEQAIWDRARSREVQMGLANEAEVGRTHEASGFHMPAGAVLAQLRAAQQDTLNKASTLSRDIAIKQADLEQSNLRETIAQAMQLESKLIDYSMDLERLSFETAKAVADNAIQVHNALVEKYRTAVLGTYEAVARAYDTLIKGELAQIDIYKAQIAGEQSKVDANRSLVEQYRAQIEGGLALVKIYEAQIGGAKARMELEGAKLAAQAEQIRAYVAGINGETARLEAYKVGVEVEKTKVEAYKVGVDAKVSQVQVFRAQTDAYQAKVGAQGEKARANLAYYNGLVSAYQARWEGWKSRVQGETARFQALTSKFGAVLDGYKAELSGVESQSNQDIKRWEVQIKEYEALQTYTFQATKQNNDVVQARSQMMLDASKAGAQIFSQLASSALSVARVSAGVDGRTSTSVGYQYSNKTATAPSSVTAI